MKQNLIDTAEFSVKAGDGGHGAASFAHRYQVIKGGPDGGDGGNGGSIYLVAEPQMATLKKFAGIDRYEAPHGGRGGPNNRHGKNADDVYIKVPVGTLVFEKLETGTVQLIDLSSSDQSFCVAKGGTGGRGNAALKSSRNTTPLEAEPGKKGEKKSIRLELKILADIGLVGLPNVGKSSLLSVLTAAKPEIANYPFTTLSPNLGVLNGLRSKVDAQNNKPETSPITIADIPGLIEDAHAGKGLGTAFLKHIERCQALVYVLSPETDLWDQYQTVKQELVEYSSKLPDKRSLIVVNKCELIEAKAPVSDRFNKQGLEVIFTSVYENIGIETLKQEIFKLVKLA